MLHAIVIVEVKPLWLKQPSAICCVYFNLKISLRLILAKSDSPAIVYLHKIRTTRETRVAHSCIFFSLETIAAGGLLLRL